MDDVAGGEGVTGVDFSDEKKAVAWLEKQTVETRSAITARAALRACPNLNMFGQSRFPLLALPLFRLIFLNFLRGSGRVTHSDWLGAKILTAQSVAMTVAGATQRDAEDYADYFSGGLTLPIIGGSTYAIAKSCDDTTAFTAVSKDSAYSSTHGYSVRLWHDLKISGKLEENHKVFVKRLKKRHTTWGFWHDWYLAMWEGRFTDWDLAIEVARIPDDVWEAGANAVAVEIEKLRQARPTQVSEPTPRERAHEPESVGQILANPAVATASFQIVAHHISVAFETFHRETGINEVPASFTPLHAVPQLLVGMGWILQQELEPTDKEQALREEVGRLNARIEELETALQTALASSDPIVGPAFKEQLGKSLGDWKLYAALMGSLWIVSGDDIGLQKRSENILSLRESLFGDVCPAPIVEGDFGIFA